MRLINLISHELIPRKCLKEIELDGYVLVCAKCREPIAICYETDSEMQVVALPRFRRYENEIKEIIKRKGAK